MRTHRKARCAGCVLCFGDESSSTPGVGGEADKTWGPTERSPEGSRGSWAERARAYVGRAKNVNATGPESNLGFVPNEAIHVPRVSLRTPSALVIGAWQRSWRGVTWGWRTLRGQESGGGAL